MVEGGGKVNYPGAMIQGTTVQGQLSGWRLSSRTVVLEPVLTIKIALRNFIK